MGIASCFEKKNVKKNVEKTEIKNDKNENNHNTIEEKIIKK